MWASSWKKIAFNWSGLSEEIRFCGSKITGRSKPQTTGLVASGEILRGICFLKPRHMQQCMSTSFSEIALLWARLTSFALITSSLIKIVLFSTIKASIVAIVIHIMNITACHDIFTVFETGTALFSCAIDSGEAASGFAATEGEIVSFTDSFCNLIEFSLVLFVGVKYCVT